MNTLLQKQTKAAPTPSFTPVQRWLLQRKCACGGSPGLTGECAECAKKNGALQRSAGNQSASGAVFSLSRIPVIQPKLTVGASNELLEQEADRGGNGVRVGLFLHEDRHAVAKGLQQKLGHMFADWAAVSLLEAMGDVSRLQMGGVMIEHGSRPQRIGESVAEGIGKEIRK